MKTDPARLDRLRGYFHTGETPIAKPDCLDEHTVAALAEQLRVEVRLLPRATPELNAMDHLWRRAKRQAVGSRATQSIEQSALAVCRYILDLPPEERLRQAGVLSGNFWLTK